jgi:hypothetical protein
LAFSPKDSISDWVASFVWEDDLKLQARTH